MRYTWLSHVLTPETAAYGGEPAIIMEPGRRIAAGDSSNTTRLILGTHAGSHVDVPRHFVASGLTVDAYVASDWVFDAPVVLDVPTEGAGLVEPRHLESVWTKAAAGSDMLLLKTGAEQWRAQRSYWESGPGLSANACEWICAEARQVRAVGLDTISLSSFSHREEGRRAHRVLLHAGVRIFEDLHLLHLSGATRLRRVIALPLRTLEGDGAPVTVMAEIE